MNLGRLRRRLQVTGRGEAAAVVRLRGDDAEVGIREQRSAPRAVADHELPPLVVVERPDEPGSNDRD